MSALFVTALLVISAWISVIIIVILVRDEITPSSEPQRASRLRGFLTASYLPAIKNVTKPDDPDTKETLSASDNRDSYLQTHVDKQDAPTTSSWASEARTTFVSWKTSSDSEEAPLQTPASARKTGVETVLITLTKASKAGASLSQATVHDDESLQKRRSKDITGDSSSSLSSQASANNDFPPRSAMARNTMKTLAKTSQSYRNITSPRPLPPPANSYNKRNFPNRSPVSKENSPTADDEVFALCGRERPAHQPKRRLRHHRRRRHRHHRRRQKRVVGGTGAGRKQFPWVAMVLVDGKFRCGASIIHKRHVLTAAHCIRGERTTVRVNGQSQSPEHTPMYRMVQKSKGKRFVAATDVEVIAGKHAYAVSSGHDKGEQRVSVDDVIPHPGYDDKAKHNDLVLLVLHQPLNRTETVRVICLPSSRDHLPSTATFAGWGSTTPRDRSMWAPSPPKVLQHLSVRVLAREDCLNLTSSYDYDIDMTQEQVCAVASRTGVSSTCYGDSGGPLFSPVRRHEGPGGGLHVQHGLLSWGFCVQRSGSPSFFTRLQSHTPWILSVIRKNNQTTESASQGRRSL